MTLTLYAAIGSPPCYTVIMCLEALGLKYTLINFDFVKGEHRTDEYAKKNPQREIPLLDDDGFYLSESNAILQYLVEKYGKDDKLYPKAAQEKAIVNHRLCFDLSTYYKSIFEHFIARLYNVKDKIPETATKLENSLNVFNIYLERLGTKYAAGDNLTIADLQFVTSTMCLEAINIDFSSHLLVKQWYETFKTENPDLQKIAEDGVKEIAKYYDEHKRG